MTTGDVLTRRALNRATLDRQRLLRRQGGTVDTIEHLVGMQAQNPLDPYYALWSRVDGFDPSELSRLLTDREAVRAQLMRGTIHLVTTRDYLSLQPIFKSVLEGVFRSTTFARDIAHLDRVALLSRSEAMLSDEHLTRAELARRLQDRWPDAPGASMAQAATYLLPVVQTTPRGVWGSTGSAKWADAGSWLGRSLLEQGSSDELVFRYLRAFGPASTSDVRAWSRVTGLREVLDRLRPELRVWRNEDGVELFDLPDLEHPDPEVPAPPRFLPEYDNVLLGHADRSRFFDTAVPPGWAGNMLVDGVYIGHWKIVETERVRDLVVTPQVKLSRTDRAEIEEEGTRLLSFVEGEGSVRFAHFV